MQVCTHFSEKKWSERHSLAGRVMLRGCVWQDENTIAELASLNSLDEISARLKNWNGFYALVISSSTRLIAIVDHIRSVPLFYGERSGTLFLSDDAEWVRWQVGDKVMDEVSQEEFQLTGYVTGQNTLFPNVKQLQAGEYLFAEVDKEGKYQYSLKRYYRFLHSEPGQFSQDVLYRELDSSAVSSVQRLINYANGRQIVVPLSGGYDSRLIATLLRRLGYDNVLAFTYGIQGNKESLYSKRVADELGIRWHFVEYSRDLWHSVWKTDVRRQYEKWASGWSSLAHIQDWLAVKILKEQDVVNADCVFAPGHTGDFISGGHVPTTAFAGKAATEFDLIESVLGKHYSLAPIPLITKRGKEFWADRIMFISEADGIKDGESLANASEKWEWQERQAKFICNSVRVYEFWGYDWWMPLWDKEFVEFWEGVPLSLRKGQQWYVNYVKYEFARNSLATGSPRINNASESLLKEIVIKSAIWKIVALKKIVKMLSARRHHLGLTGALQNQFVNGLTRKNFRLNGIMAKAFLNEYKSVE